MNTVRYHCLERDVSTDAERPTILSNPKRPDMGSTPESGRQSGKSSTWTQAPVNHFVSSPRDSRTSLVWER
ncbi:hypothetical protein CCHR01_17586 [Colletotrichum chrysophilum]|uniref:Uncharacterized protein n=1 Tax=Colletotrichum chrysophilum TaxID=1836956 RepID=A0AAD9E6R4_9PEZI|nr:hypothetical protein CCHR01_17586 [Colletotrichum chrysophilum]